MESPLRLKEARKSAGLTQKQVAEKLGISQNNYSYWENGKVKVDSSNLSQLAEIFGCSVDYLLGKCNEKKPNLTNRFAREIELIDFILSGESRFLFYSELNTEDRTLFFFLLLHSNKELLEYKEVLELKAKKVDEIGFFADERDAYQRKNKEKDDK